MKKKKNEKSSTSTNTPNFSLQISTLAHGSSSRFPFYKQIRNQEVRYFSQELLNINELNLTNQKRYCSKSNTRILIEYNVKSYGGVRKSPNFSASLQNHLYAF